VQLAREFALPNGKGHYQFPYLHVTVAPGRPTAVVFGGPGRPVVGKLTGMDSYEGLTLSLAPRAPRPGDQDLWAGFQAVAKSDLGPVFHRNDLPVNKDGTFRIDRVLPENYQLFVRTKDNSVYHVQQLQVTAPPAGQPDQAQDVGTIQLKKRAAAAAEPPAANQVIDAQGRPIAGATIELQPYELEPKTVLARTTTDAQGHFTYPAETPAKDYFFVRVSAPGFRAERWLGNYVVHVRRDGKPVPDVFRLNRPVTLEGRVLGVGGKPLAGVPLAFDFVNDHMRSINHLQFNSDAEGRFRLEGLPAGDLYVRYSRTRDQADPAPPQAQLYIARVQATEGQTIRDVVVDLGQAVYHLEGQVVDAQGAGVADAHVTVGFAPWALDHTVHTTTDARGNFRVEGLQPHAFAVTASKGGVGLGEAVPVEVPPDRPAYVKLRAFTPGQPPPAARPALPWGPAHDGLQAVTVVEPQEADHAIGKVVQVRVLVRNAGDKPRQFTDTWAFNALFVTGPDGQPQRFDYSHFTGLPWGVTYRLEPGQEVLLKGSFSLALVGKGDSGRQAMFQATVAPATTYRLAVRIGQGYGDEEVKADAGKVKDRLVPGETVLKVR
jgi:protocatechuate 3,4-dioxygenase beta subunit